MRRMRKRAAGEGRRRGPQERAAGEGRGRGPRERDVRPNGASSRKRLQRITLENHPQETPKGDSQGTSRREPTGGTAENTTGIPTGNARKERPQGTPARNARKERQQELTSKGSHQTRSVRKRSIYENPQENRSAEDCPDRQSSALFLQNGWFPFFFASSCALSARYLRGTTVQDRRTGGRNGAAARAGSDGRRAGTAKRRASPRMSSEPRLLAA